MSETADRDEAANTSRARRRRVIVAGGLVTVALAVSAAVTASARTPAQHAADREPAAPQLVTVTPQLRELREVRLASCTLEVAEQTFTVPGSAAAPRSVFTAVDVAPGQGLEPGRRVAEISGRPLIALDLPFPLYRDLRPLDVGPDVTALQDALVRLGRLDAASGTVERATQSAVERMYRDLGAAPPRTGADLDAALAQAQAAESELAARANAGETLPVGAVRSATQARQLAQSRIGTMVPIAEVLAATTTWPVHQVPAIVGADAAEGDPVVVVRGPSATATCSLSLESATAVTAGMPATLSSAGAPPVPGVVSAVALTADAATLSFSAELPVTPGVTGASPAALEIVVATSGGPVLAVPAGVLREGADGMFVQVREGSEVKGVSVTVGFVADGWVELRNTTLDPTADVVVELDTTGP